jgi:hypothetical protein
MESLVIRLAVEQSLVFLQRRLVFAGLILSKRFGRRCVQTDGQDDHEEKCHRFPQFRVGRSQDRLTPTNALPFGQEKFQDEQKDSQAERPLVAFMESLQAFGRKFCLWQRRQSLFVERFDHARSSQGKVKPIRGLGYFSEHGFIETRFHDVARLVFDVGEISLLVFQAKQFAFGCSHADGKDAQPSLSGAFCRFCSSRFMVLAIREHNEDFHILALILKCRHGGLNCFVRAVPPAG